MINMTWKKVEIEEQKDYENFERADLSDIGDSVEGKLVSVFEAKYGHGYVIEQSEDTAKVVYPNYDLEQKLKTLESGIEVKITFSGTEDIGKLQPMKIYEVLYKDGE